MSDWLHSNQLHKEEKDRGIRPNSYANYFESYIKKEVPLPNGRGTRTVRVYTGHYYVEQCTDKQWLIRKILIFALSLFSFTLFAVCASVKTPGNQVSYIRLLTCAVLFGYFYLLYSLINYLPSSRKMTVGSYRTVNRLVLYASITVIITDAALITGRVAAFIQNFGTDLPAGIFCLLGFIASQICSIAIYLIRKRSVYECTPTVSDTVK